MNKRITALMLALVMVVAMLSGCSSDAPEVSEAPASEAVSQAPEAPAESEAPEAPEAPAETGEEGEEPAELEAPEGLPVYDLPLTDETVTFTHWGEGSPPFIAQYLGAEQSFNTAEATFYMEELTGVHIEYVEVDMFSKAERFNLMIASGDYTDMIVGFDAMYSGGPAQALEDEVIFDLTDYVENSMPAYKQVFESLGLRSALLSDNNEFLYITGFDDEVYAGAGPAIREDWLSELGLEIPTTYDELHDVAVAFKENYDCTMPLYFTASLNPGVWFCGGFDIPAFDIKTNGSHFYQIDGQVQSAYVAEGCKDMIRLISQYYQEGLISRDFISREMGQDCEGDLFSGNVGIYTSEANFITDYNIMEDNIANGFHVVGMPMITHEEGEIIHFSAVTSNGTGRNTICITTNCEDVEMLTKFLDFQFTEQGQLLNNYGMEGITYTLDDNGDPQWMEGLPMSGIAFMQASVPYIINALPSFYDADRRDKMTLDADALAARELYNQGTDGAYDMPIGMSFNTEESEVFYRYISDVDTYAAEFLLRCVYGEEDLDAGWDDYVDMLYNLGLQECIDMKQVAYERYMAR